MRRDGLPRETLPGQAPPDRLVSRVAGLLTAGTLASLVLVAVGLTLELAAGRTALSDEGPPFDVAGVAADLLSLRADGVLWLGLAATVLLPVGRVALALLEFARAGEWRMAGFGIGTLSVLAVSVTVALLTR